MKTEKNKVLKIIVSFVCTFAVLCLILLLPISASIIDDSQENKCSADDYTFVSKSKPLFLNYTQNESNQYEHGSVIEQTYEIVSSHSFDSYVVSINVCEGIILESPSIISFSESDSKLFTVKFRITDNDFFSDNVVVHVASYNNNDSKSSKSLLRFGV